MIRNTLSTIINYLQYQKLDNQHIFSQHNLQRRHFYYHARHEHSLLLDSLIPAVPDGDRGVQRPSVAAICRRCRWFKSLSGADLPNSSSNYTDRRRIPAQRHRLTGKSATVIWPLSSDRTASSIDHADPSIWAGRRTQPLALAGCWLNFD